MKTLVLVTDAFGGRGGLALYGRQLIQGLCNYPSMNRVVAIPRLITYDLEPMPPKLDYRREAAGSKLRFVLACLRMVITERCFDLIVCAHIHLLPFAYLLGWVYRCPVLPFVYGIDAWKPTRHRLVNVLCRKLDTFVAMRRLTAQRLIQWAGLDDCRVYYLPNAIDESRYGVKPRNEVLIERYGLRGKTVIATAGRLDTSKNDHFKGFDEVIEVLPELRRRIPNLAYLIMGDGLDRTRLAEKARALNVTDLVVFTGYVRDDEKADHYRLADVFAMPGRNAMFDRYPWRFVFLEALACGVPVVGSRPEEGLDADSHLIRFVDPNNPDEIVAGILEALRAPRGRIQAGVEKFYVGSFYLRVHDILSDMVLRHNLATDGARAAG